MASQEGPSQLKKDIMNYIEKTTNQQKKQGILLQIKLFSPDKSKKKILS